MIPERIILIGFRATGKSAVGRELAKRIGYSFVDTDLVLQKQFGCSINEFIAKKGWKDFRRQEQNLLLQLKHQSQRVIATGGGAVLHQEAIKSLQDNSLIILLKADARTIKKRIGHDKNSQAQRPPLQGKDAGEEVDQLLTERDPLYHDAAHLAIGTDHLSITEIVDQIEQALQNPEQTLN